MADREAGGPGYPPTIEAYKALPKAQQDDLKDIGRYILGELEGGRRKAGAVLSRCAAVLDADNLPAGGTDEFIRRVAALGLCCCVYSTAKHCPRLPGSGWYSPLRRTSRRNSTRLWPVCCAGASSRK